MKRKRIAVIATIFIFSLLAIVGAGYLVHSGSNGRLYSDVTKIPHRRVGLLLGCSGTLEGGEINQFFGNRLAAAMDLFRHGKVDYLLVSGDNRSKGYNEAAYMKKCLMLAGIPAPRIYCDFAGIRTLDSVLRARDVFGQKEITVISQDFHNRRAIFIASHNDMDAIGFNAAEVDAYNGFRTKAREQLARVRMVLDVYLFGTTPKFLGQRIEIGVQPPVSEDR